MIFPLSSSIRDDGGDCLYREMKVGAGEWGIIFRMGIVLRSLGLSPHGARTSTDKYYSNGSIIVTPREGFELEVSTAVEKRRAKRILDERPIDNEILKQMIQGMRLAPSCFNNQPLKVVVVSNDDELNKIKDCLAGGNRWARKAPLILVVTARKDDDCSLSDRRDYYLFDCGLAVGQMLLVATELGLIAHPIAGYSPEGVRTVLNVPEEYVIIALVICGYPGTDGSLLSEKQKEAERNRPERKPIGESFFDQWWDVPLEI